MALYQCYLKSFVFLMPNLFVPVAIGSADDSTISFRLRLQCCCGSHSISWASNFFNQVPPYHFIAAVIWPLSGGEMLVDKLTFVAILTLKIILVGI